MAQTTVELRRLLGGKIDLFDFDYDFDDKKMAATIEEEVISYFYFHEIGQEAIDLFKHRFQTRFKRIISYYNKLYNTTLLEYNPLINQKITEALDQLATTDNTTDSTQDITATGKTDYDSNSKTDNTGTNTNTRTDNLKNTLNLDEKASDYPQQTITSGDYLSGAKLAKQDGTNTGTVKDDGSVSNNTKTTADSTTNTNDTSNTTGNTKSKGKQNTTYEKKIEGITGITYQELVRQERDNILRITSMIIEELKPCFMMVY